MLRDFNQLWLGGGPIRRLQGFLRDMKRGIDECVFAETFKSTIENSPWLLNKSFSPGRGAVGFHYLYVLYRALNDAKPIRILDIGMGQTTKMISQYAAANPDIKHVIVEASADWINVFQKMFSLPANSQVLKLEYGMRDFMGYPNVRVFKDFIESLKGEKFDLISIDGPVSVDMDRYARIDCVDMIPNQLHDDFTIIIDDVDREPDRKTVDLIVGKLHKSGIDYSIAYYSGVKDCAIIASKSRSFMSFL